MINAIENPLPKIVSKFIARNHKFVFYLYCCISKDHPGSTWNGYNTVTAPVEPEVLASYALFIKRKFPRAVAECPFEIQVPPFHS